MSCTEGEKWGWRGMEDSRRVDGSYSRAVRVSMPSALIPRALSLWTARRAGFIQPGVSTPGRGSHLHPVSPSLLPGVDTPGWINPALRAGRGRRLLTPLSEHLFAVLFTVQHD